MADELKKFIDFVTLREDIRDYFGVRDREDIEDISSDVDFRTTRWKEEIGSEIIERLEDLKRVAEDYLREKYTPLRK